MTPAELLDDPWATGPWCWRVGEVRLLPEPIACRGMQGLWPVEDIDESVAQALDDLVPGRVRTWTALTLLQPYASAIAAGVKRIENRPWRRAIGPKGMWVGLHAGKALYIPDDAVLPKRVCGQTRAEQAREYTEDLLNGWRVRNVLRSEPYWPDAPAVDDLPLGVMLGAMHVAEILRYPEGGSLFDGVAS